MSDAPAILRFSAPPATDDDGSAIARGLFHGVLLSVPLWALIGVAVAALF